MKRAVLTLALAACTDVVDEGGPWQPPEMITGDLAPELGPEPAPLAAPSTLRVATWNVHFGKDVATLAANIQASEVLAAADVLLVQEIEAYPEEAGSRTQRIAEQLGMTWFYAPARVAGDGTHGDAILSRFPLLAPEVKQLPLVDQPVGGSQRIALRSVIDLGGRTLTLVNVHLDTRLSAVDRIRQLHPAVFDNPPDALVGGDLNTLPWIWVETLVPLTVTEAIVGQDQAQVIDDYLHALGYVTPIVHDADTHESPIDLRLDALCPRGFTDRKSVV